MFQTAQSESIRPIEIPEQKPLRALLLDDSDFDRARLRRLNSKTELGIKLDEVGSIAELDGAVRRASYDLILIDYRLPVGDGMMALSHILDDPMNCDAAKIMITGSAAVDTAVQAMRGGCHDFLSKENMNTATLRDAMVNAMSIARHKARLTALADHQSEVIKNGLVAAFSDREVQENVLSLINAQMCLRQKEMPKASLEMEQWSSELGDEDEFVFH